MALDPSARYPSQTDDTDAAYPHGKAQNKSGPDTNDGTPYEADVVNDLWGFQQELLSEAGITPSGNPDEVGTSDYVDALDTLYYRKADADAKFHEDGDNATLADLTVTGAFTPASGYLLKSVQVLTADGTWNKPSDVRAVRVIVVGGGGGGGGAQADAGEYSVGGGGGGGGTAIGLIASPGASETVTVGAGGPGGDSTPSNGTDGGSSSFGSHLSAAGGGKGTGQNDGLGGARGAGGSGSGGDVNIYGSDGGRGPWNSSGVQTPGGVGGGSYLGGEARTNVMPGEPGKPYGGGGSGAAVSAGNSAAGGAGADGVVIIEEYV